MSEITEERLEDIEALFVQTAASMTGEGDRMVLHGMSPSTLYFADRPQREIGHMSTRSFVEFWGEGENSFAGDPPNAVLSFAEPGDRPPEDVVVVLQEPGSRAPAQLRDQDPRWHPSRRDRAVRLVHRPVRSPALSGLRRRHAPTGAATPSLKASCETEHSAMIPCESER